MTIQQFLGVLRARKWIAFLVLLVTVGTTASVTWFLPVRWMATSSVLVDSKGPDAITGIFLPAQMLSGYMATQVDVIQSRTVALKVVDALKLHESAATKEQWRKATDGRGSLKVWLADSLLKSVEVKPARESSVVHIAFLGPDPKFAAAVANAFAQAYIETNLELKVEPARQAAQWLGERTQALRRDIEGSAAKLADYQQQKGIVSLDERLDTENARLEQFNAQLSQASAQTADAKSRHRLAAEATTHGGAPDSIPEVVANLLVQSLKAELSRKEGRLKELSVQLGANHPQYQAAAADVQASQQKLSAEMAGVVVSLANNARIAERREADLRSQVRAQKTRVLSLKKERDELSALMREAENAQKAFDVTTQRYTQTSLESKATQTNVAVLSPAVEPIHPSFPDWRRNMALALVVGSVLGLGVALLLEMLDKRVRSGADVTATLGLPLLATLPHTHSPRATPSRLLTHRPSGAA